ncbi:MAG: hypothetical protein KatS3mg105_0841 [Gemmatales bacterium]|nr:MAG: hypothetical protein KatS3mg105_0841 [Gemmatales bacterium]
MSTQQNHLEQEPEALAAEKDQKLKQEIPAAEALELIRQGKPIEDAIIHRLEFQGEFTAPIELRHVTLVHPRFDHAVFHDRVSFFGCTLIRPRFVGKTVFEAALNLKGSTLMAAGFNGVRFKGSLRCDNVHCEGHLRLVHCEFETVRFWQAHFEDWVNFGDCTFHEEVDLRSLHAKEGIVFKDCRFERDVLLRGATVDKKLEATGSRFEGLVDFSKAKLHDYVYLEGIEQGEKQRFAFNNTLGERILVRTCQLEGRLFSEENGNYEQARHEYAFLKRAFEALHRYEQEDWAFYRFKVNERRSFNRSWARPWTKVTQFANWLLLDHGCGYCTDPYRAIRTAVIIMVLFGVIYSFGINTFYFDSQRLPFPDQPITSWGNRVLVAMMTSVSIFTAGVGGIRDLARGWMNVPLIIESLLGTLLWGLFIIAFSRKVIR